MRIAMLPFLIAACSFERLPAVAGSDSQIMLSSGDGQSGTAGSPLSQPLVVTVVDAEQQVMANVTVAFVVTAGGGAVSPLAVATDSSPTAGTQVAPLVFAADYAESNPIAAAIASSATPHSNGNVSGGSVSVVSTTDTQGQAQATLTLGATAGTNTVEARSDGLTNSPIVFDATGLAGPASELAIVSGNNQSATFGGVLSAPLVVLVTDVHSNPVSGFAVSFVVTAGGGSVLPATVLTDAQGKAQTRFTLATTPGATNFVEARTPGLSGSPGVFAALATSFAAKVDFVANSNHTFIALGDVNGDGKADLAVTDSGSIVSVLLNTTVMGAVTPTFAAARPFSTVFLNTTVLGAVTPSFAAKVDFPTGSNPCSVVLGDINGGDSKPDLAVANRASNSVSILLNTTTVGSTTPNFAAKVDFSTGLSPFSVALSDMNGDGKPDLAVANSSSTTVSVLLNTTALGTPVPSFAAKSDFPTGSSSLGVAVADLNGDGKPDLAVADAGGNALSVLINVTGLAAVTPSFASKVDFPTGIAPFAVAAGDLNGDGKLDLAVTNNTSNTVSVLLAQ